MINYKVITLHQPYATLLAHGIKMNETRPKPTKHIQYLKLKTRSIGFSECIPDKNVYLIHAAKKWTMEQHDLCLTEPFKSSLEGLGYPSSLESSYASVNGLEGVVFPLGQIIGSFEVDECVTVLEQEFENGELNNVQLNDNHNTDIKQRIFKVDELTFGDYNIGRSIWMGINHKVLKTPIEYKGQQGFLL